MSGEGQLGASKSHLMAQGINAPGLTVATGVQTTVAASDSVPTGLSSVVAVFATLNSDPVAGCQFVTAAIGAAGAISLKTWMATAAGNTALIAATTFGKSVSWVAYGYP